MLTRKTLPASATSRSQSVASVAGALGVSAAEPAADRRTAPGTGPTILDMESAICRCQSFASIAAALVADGLAPPLKDGRGLYELTEEQVDQIFFAVTETYAEAQRVHREWEALHDAEKERQGRAG